MRIKKNELKEFKQIYYEEYGVKPTDLGATKKALNVLKGVEMILEFNQNPISGIDKKSKVDNHGK